MDTIAALVTMNTEVWVKSILRDRERRFARILSTPASSRARLVTRQNPEP
jgi:hypothetical protein